MRSCLVTWSLVKGPPKARLAFGGQRKDGSGKNENRERGLKCRLSRGNALPRVGFVTIAAHEGFLMGVGALVTDAMLAPLKCSGTVLALVLSTRAAAARNRSSPRSDCDCGQAMVGGRRHTRGTSVPRVKLLASRSKPKQRSRDG